MVCADTKHVAQVSKNLTQTLYQQALEAKAKADAAQLVANEKRLLAEQERQEAKAARDRADAARAQAEASAAAALVLIQQARNASVAGQEHAKQLQQQAEDAQIKADAERVRADELIAISKTEMEQSQKSAAVCVVQQKAVVAATQELNQQEKVARQAKAKFMKAQMAAILAAQRAKKEVSEAERAMALAESAPGRAQEMQQARLVAVEEAKLAQSRLIELESLLDQLTRAKLVLSLNEPAVTFWASKPGQVAYCSSCSVSCHSPLLSSAFLFLIIPWC